MASLRTLSKKYKMELKDVKDLWKERYGMALAILKGKNERMTPEELSYSLLVSHLRKQQKVKKIRGIVTGE